MKRLLSLLLISLPLVTLAQGIKFEEGLSWEQVKQKAKTENKYIFVDCYATWCGPCKWMDKEIYTNDTVGTFFNKKFISVKVQMDTSKSDNELIKGWYSAAAIIKNKYKVASFPTYLFFSSDGEVVHREGGAKRPEEFIAVGVNALNADKQYYTTLEKYRRNELDTAFMKTLAHKVKDIEGEDLAKKIANNYINRLPINALFTRENIWFMYEFTKSSKDRGFVLFRDSAKRISKTDERIKESNSKSIVLSIINNEEIKPYATTKNGKPDWKKIQSNLKKYGALGEEAFTRYKPGIIFKTEILPALKVNSDWNKILPLINKHNLGPNAEFVVGSTIIYYLQGIHSYRTEKNCKNLVAAASYYANTFPTFLTSRALNDWGWIIFKHSKDKNELNQALIWSKQSLGLMGDKPGAEELDTYANLLYKLGRVQEAIEWQKKAVAASNGSLTIKETLEKMVRGEKTWAE